MFILLIIAVGILVLYAIYIFYFLTGLYRLSKQPSVYSTLEPSVSVIVAARNEEENIGHLLEDLTKQTYDKNNIEIIIASDRSTDKTDEIISQYQSNFSHIKSVKIKTKSEEMTPKKFALTKAIEKSKGDIIISTDADCRVSETWVSSMVRQFDTETGLVIGYSKIDDRDDSYFSNFQKVDFLALMAANAGSFGWGIPWTGSGQNIAYRRAWFNKIGGFDPVSDQISGDDFYLVQSISKIAKTRYNPNPDGFVKTQPMKSLNAFLNQRTRWASNAQKLFNSDFFFLIFLFLNLFVNSILFVGIFITTTWAYLPSFFGIKLLFESLVIAYAAIIFNTKFNIGIYLLWALFQPVYIPMLTLKSMFGKFRWKE
jgi:cellulose synthase/poly-beta-1,6-N-acetylglucosamine synthase-like glycosyltransferase